MRSAKKEGAFRVNFMSSENPLLYWVLVAGLCIHVQKKRIRKKKRIRYYEFNLFYRITYLCLNKIVSTSHILQMQ